MLKLSKGGKTVLASCLGEKGEHKIQIPRED